MRVVSFTKLRDFYEAGHADAVGPLRAWYPTILQSRWRGFADFWDEFPSADQVGERAVFNIAGNKYRLVVRVDYVRHGVLVRFVGTHAEYDKIDVKTI